MKRIIPFMVFVFSCVSVPVSNFEFVDVSHISFDSQTDDVPLDVPKATIVLSPGWLPDDVSVFESLRPKFVCWGNSPVWTGDAMGRDIQRLRDIGLEQIAADTWSLSAGNIALSGNPEVYNATAIDFEGKRFVPEWLADSSIKGKPMYWSCTNNPVFREEVYAQVKTSLRLGADVIHLDDPAGSLNVSLNKPGCFCDYCMSGFRAYLAERYTTDKLAQLGVMDVNSFYYKDYLRSKGYRSNYSVTHAKYNGKLPLYKEFIDFQISATRGYLAELKSRAAEYAGRPVSLGTNAYNLQAEQLFNADIADYFANEIRYDGDYHSVFAYHIADALNKPVFATAGGEAWVRVAKTEAMREMLYWFSEAYASGQFFAYAYKVWGWSHETGTQWNVIPPELLQPYADFINDNPELFNSYSSLSRIDVVYNNAAVGAQRDATEKTARALFEQNIPYRLIPAGNRFLPAELVVNTIAEDSPLLVPDTYGLNKRDADLLDRRKVIKSDDIDSFINSRDPFFMSESHIRVLPREKDGLIALHLLNVDYENVGGTDFELFISNKIVDVNKLKSISFHAPGYNSEAVDWNGVEGGFIIKVPGLDIWGILELQHG